MAEISKQSPWRTPPEKQMGFLQMGDEDGQRRGSENKKTQRTEGSVLLDMERLSLLAEPGVIANSTAEAGAATNPRSPMLLQKTLSRKFSQRGDRKAADGDNLLPTATPFANGGGRGGAYLPSASAAATTAASSPAAAPPDKFVAVVLASAVSPEATATATASPRQAAPCRRAHGRRAPAFSPWLDPRRVLLLFATLSSMGTIILLYFTLSTGKMGDGDANAR